MDNLSRPGSTINKDWLEEGNGKWSCEHADIRNAADVSRILQKHPDVDLILHAAAQVAVTTSVRDPLLDFEVNALGTFNLLEAVRKCCPETFLIYTSTNKVYGCMESVPVQEINGRYAFVDLPRGVCESQNLDFHSPYGCSKGAADQYVHDYGRIYDLRTVVCRQSCIYGTRQFGVEDQGWVAWFLIAALNELPVVVYGDGKQVRDVLWIDDLIDLFLILYRQSALAVGKTYNVGGGIENAFSLNELIEAIPDLTGTALTMSSADWRAGDQKIYISDISALSRDLGWKPKVGVSEGLSLLVDWLKQNSHLIRAVLRDRYSLREKKDAI